MPESGDMIEVNYTGALGNELVFDSSFPRGQPYVYRINTGQVIKGWDDGLSNFKEGTEAILFIPSAMGYGATGSSPNIPPDSELIFYVNLYKVRKM
ncbi:MAG: FKBP-type peptidyl-prolyl cis-trans isomerase [Saprospiraceae bacterium]|nr:FKBP-type peptidyl-prolyl cis-trans isomerase [Saprospiraceae bacterium]